MATQNYFSHTSLDGRTLSQRLTNAGYAGAFPWGENIAAGQPTPQAVVDAWMSSPGHCTNIMNGSYRAIGVGYAFRAGSTYGHYWTQDFGELAFDWSERPIQQSSVSLIISVGGYHPLMTRHLFVTLLAVGIAAPLDGARGAMSESRMAPAVAQDRPTIGETITTESGLVYKFTQLGSGPQPQTGDLMVIHGIGTLADGKEFWNTRTDGSPYEYTLGVDSVIRGFSEGMRIVREGDRIIITMKPELGYGPRERTGIPANSTLVFDYEILAVKPLSFAKLMRDAIAAGTVDEAIAKVKATPNLKDYYVSASSVQAAANAANRKEAGTNEKVLALGLTLLPDAYQLHQTSGPAPGHTRRQTRSHQELRDGAEAQSEEDGG